jgi:hypothetical protein
MSRDPAPTRKQRRDQQTNFMLTLDEKAQLHAFAERRMMTISNACRYLIMKGLATEDEGE